MVPAAVATTAFATVVPIDFLGGGGVSGILTGVGGEGWSEAEGGGGENTGMVSEGKKVSMF